MDIVSFVKRNHLIYEIYFSLFSLFVKVMKCFVKPDAHLILFVSFGGRYFNDNPKVLYDAMLKDSRFADYKLVWAFLKPQEIELKTPKININSIKYIITALKARCWVTNVSMERGLNFKGSKTFYFHTTHTYLPKCMGFDDHNGIKFKTKCNYDCSCAQSEQEKRWQMSGYGLNENQVFVSGYPKNDKLCSYTEAERNAIREKLHIKENAKVILYAPTFRDENYGAMKCPIDFKKWESILGKDFVLLFRAHPVVANATDLDTTTGFIIDVSTYPDNVELMIASDILISDYSGIFFEYAVQRKPMFCYAYDYDEYIKTRELYFDIRKELPGGMLNEEDLLHVIKTGCYSEFDNQWQSFRDNYVAEYGHSTEKCLDRIFDEIR